MKVKGEIFSENKFFKISFDFFDFEKYLCFSYMCELRDVPNFVEELFVLDISKILLDIEIQSDFDKTFGIIKAGIFPVIKSSYDDVSSKICGVHISIRQRPNARLCIRVYSQNSCLRFHILQIYY